MPARFTEVSPPPLSLLDYEYRGVLIKWMSCRVSYGISLYSKIHELPFTEEFIGLSLCLIGQDEVTTSPCCASVRVQFAAHNNQIP